jgi:hypothetical protein
VSGMPIPRAGSPRPRPRRAGGSASHGRRVIGSVVVSSMHGVHVRSRRRVMWASGSSRLWARRARPRIHRPVRLGHGGRVSAATAGRRRGGLPTWFRTSPGQPARPLHVLCPSWVMGELGSGSFCRPRQSSVSQ